ncbi:hypothetical protein SELMODRAFT_271323 [Selaginella moellendorffii]|uniref:Protoporphyrinogen oxidase n=1 Tax=Selaginella moellendorffii TaxID=88036 RepID=D8S5L9_SELML|nr:protoporphyrinogen oxidase 2, chloroplastic/mitochondrial [Selaginella moellendorffii]EFJ20080.1 hypothetical protein SELMODRAFT_271323 [Selaginella moellendorffii]|eukprot:XP_024539527.1 protoporphyrinogen oxidase 2, chloroplastic/mitochondrial [Selaginella moellendorffii]
MAMAEGETAPVLGSVAVVGAGASGLAAAYRLRAAGVSVTVYEAENSIGGKLKSVSENGFIWEKGPNTMTENDPSISRMFDDLHLRDKQQFPVEQKKRYIVRNASPTMLPSNPLGFITTGLFSAQAKLKLLTEPFSWKRTKAESNEDESVGAFMERHFGDEIVDYAVDPFVAGTSGSDPSSISIRHSFPELWSLEKNYGSLFVGAIKSGFSKKKKQKLRPVEFEDEDSDFPARTRPRRGGSFSFVGGMQTLANELVSRIGKEKFKLNTFVTGLACNQQGNPSRQSWTVTGLETSGKRSKRSDKTFDAVIMTAPVDDVRAMKVVKDGKPYALDYLPTVIYEPMSVLITMFNKDSVKRALPGFGVLVPSKEQQANGFQTLGTLFSSFMFPDRAPEDQLLFTTFIGGSRNTLLASRSKEELLDITLKDLSRLIGVEGQPTAIRHVYWEKAFPRYSIGYDNVLHSIQKLESDLPGLFYAGNHRGGLAVGKTIVSGLDAAEQVLQYLQGSGGKKVFTMASLEQPVS